MSKKMIIEQLIKDCKLLNNLVCKFNGDKIQYAIYLRNMSYDELMVEKSTLEKLFL